MEKYLIILVWKRFSILGQVIFDILYYINTIVKEFESKGEKLNKIVKAPVTNNLFIERDSVKKTTEILWY